MGAAFKAAMMDEAETAATQAGLSERRTFCRTFQRTFRHPLNISRAALSRRNPPESRCLPTCRTRHCYEGNPA